MSTPFRARPGRFLLVLLCICTPLAVARHANASGALAPEAVFETLATPEPGRLNAYLGGDIGVLRRDYASLYLWAAQRALRGRPLSANEIAVARTTQLEIGGEEDGLAFWQRQREAFSARSGAPPAPEIEVFGTLDDGDVDTGFLNCQDDAFMTAGKRLQDHAARVPDGDAEALRWVQDWALGQDAVFANCAVIGGTDPVPAPAGAPAWLVADRAYQQAAALFYRGESERAATAFAEIAGDATSPWRAVAGYLVARVWVREALYFTEQGPARVEALARAAAAAEAGLANPSLRDRHEAFGRLARRVALLRDPRAAFEAAVARLDEGAPDEDFVQDLEEVRFLRDDVPAEVAIRAWLLNVRADASADAYPVALAQWRASGTRDWLLATLLHAPVTDPGADAALAAVAALPEGTPALFPLQFERARLLGARGDASALPLIDGLLARTDLATSDRNALRALRFAASRSVAEAMAHATGRIIGVTYENERDLWQDWQRVPEPDATIPVAVKARPAGEDAAGTGADEGTDAGDDRDWEAESWPLLPALRAQPALLPDPAAQLDRWLSARMLGAAATADGSALPEEVRRQLLGVAWLRAWLLRQEDVLDALSPAFARLHPAQAPLLAAGVDGASISGVPSQGTFRAALVSLRLPGLSPHVRAGIGRAAPAESVGQLGLWRWWQDGAEAFDLTNAVDAPAFVDADIAAVANAERAALAHIEDATRLLGRIVLAYAAAKPADPDVPEALHLLVRATRFGTPDSAISRRAYTRLHERYPGSSWAKKTPYFF